MEVRMFLMHRAQSLKNVWYYKEKYVFKAQFGQA
jgi:hypothetical protein